MVQKDSKEVESDGKPKWAETWDTSNSIPWRVKVTFRMKPPEKGDDPLPILRVVEIPVAQLSQNPFSLDDNETNAAKEDAARRGGRTQTTGGANGGGSGPGGGMPGGGGGPGGGGK